MQSASFHATLSGVVALNSRLAWTSRMSTMELVREASMRSVTRPCPARAPTMISSIRTSRDPIDVIPRSKTLRGSPSTRARLYVTAKVPARAKKPVIHAIVSFEASPAAQSVSPITMRASA